MRPQTIFRVAALFLSFAALASCENKEAAKTLYIKALESYEQKDLKSAEAFINQCAKHDKKNDQAKFLKAKIKFFQERREDALEILLDLEKRNSDNKEIKRLLIKCLLLDGRVHEAAEKIQRELKLDRGDWRLYQLAAFAAAKENDVEKRLYNLSQAAESLEGAAQIYFELSQIWTSLGIDEKAKDCEKKCEALDKSLADFFSRKIAESEFFEMPLIATEGKKPSPKPVTGFSQQE